MDKHVTLEYTGERRAIAVVDAYYIFTAYAHAHLHAHTHIHAYVHIYVYVRTCIYANICIFIPEINRCRTSDSSCGRTSQTCR